MPKLLLLLGVAIVCAGPAFGQKGSAEAGFYPRGYYGDTWTGVVTSTNEDTREFTLTYKKKDKEETFTGVLPKEYTHKTADGKDVQINLADLMGMTIRAYYTSSTKKVNDQKVKYNDVLKIKILALAKP